MLLGNKADSKIYLESLRKQGIEIGEGTVLFSGPTHCNIDTQNPHLLTIGKNVQITHGVIMLTHDYSWSVIKGKYGEVYGGQAPLTIGDNVFIGMNAILLAGTTVGNNVVIGAGSVVKGDIPSDVVVAGNPAHVICSIEEYRNKRRERQLAEAVDIYCRYYRRFGRKPDKEIFREYFWLFTSASDELNSQFSEVNGYIDRALTNDIFGSWTPVFPDYKSFEKHCQDYMIKTGSDEKRYPWPELDAKYQQQLAGGSRSASSHRDYYFTSFKDWRRL